MMKQHKLPCESCPYRRDSVKGYLGDCSNDPIQFITGRMHHEKHECHSTVDYDDVDTVSEQVAKAPTCAGFAIMCKNMAKLPYNRESCDLIKEVEPDRETVFSHIAEFINYHKGENK